MSPARPRTDEQEPAPPPQAEPQRSSVTVRRWRNSRGHVITVVAGTSAAELAELVRIALAAEARIVDGGGEEPEA